MPISFRGHSLNRWISAGDGGSTPASLKKHGSAESYRHVRWCACE